MGVRVVWAGVVGGVCFVGVRIGAGVCVAAACVIVVRAAVCVAAVVAWRGFVPGESEGEGVECGGVFLDGEACAFHVALGASVCLRVGDNGVCLRARFVDDGVCLFARVVDDGVCLFPRVVDGLFGLLTGLVEGFFEGGGDVVKRVGGVCRFVAFHDCLFPFLSFVRVLCVMFVRFCRVGARSAATGGLRVRVRWRRVALPYCVTGTFLDARRSRSGSRLSYLRVWRSFRAR